MTIFIIIAWKKSNVNKSAGGLFVIASIKCTEAKGIDAGKDEIG